MAATMDAMAQALRNRLIERSVSGVQFVGIVSNGVHIANRLRKYLVQTPSFSCLDQPIALNVALYRDDLSKKNTEYISMTAANQLGQIDGRHVVMCDDVVASGRTARAALNAMFDFGRPRSVDFIAMYDRMNRELPIQPSLIGEPVMADSRVRVTVEFCEVTGMDQVILTEN